MLTEWQMEEMLERQMDALQARLYAADPYENELKAAAPDLLSAVKNLEEGSDNLADAISRLKDCPEKYRIDSLQYTLEKLIAAVADYAEKYGRGVR